MSALRRSPEYRPRRRFRFSIGWVGFVLPTLALVGCASTPPLTEHDLGTEIPDRWAADSVSDSPDADPATAGSDPLARIPIDSAWWSELGDPQLDRLVNEAFDHNRDLQAAAARIEIAIAQAKIAGADRYPSVNLEGTGARRRQNFIGLPIPGAPDGSVASSTATSWSANLSATWEVDLWGRVRHGSVAAGADLEASEADYASARLSIAALTAKSWFGVTEARKQLELAQETVDSYSISVGQVRDRFERGVRPSLDLRLALSSLASAEALLDERRAILDRQTRQLEVVLGRYPSHEPEGAPDLPSIETEIPAGLPAELVFRRPDLVAAERRWVASDKRVASAKASLYPRISLTASGGQATSDLQDLTNGDFSVWSFVGNLVQPIFQGGRLRANVDAAKGTRALSAAQFAGAALQAFAEVESFLAIESYQAGQLASLEEASRQAAAARALAQERYNSGLVDYVTVLDAWRTALETDRRLLSLRRTRLETRIDLIMALGGGYTPTVPIETADAGGVAEPALDSGVSDASSRPESPR